VLVDSGTLAIIGGPFRRSLKCGMLLAHFKPTFPHSKYWGDDDIYLMGLREIINS
jgi:hypothetical protein